MLLLLISLLFAPQQRAEDFQAQGRRQMENPNEPLPPPRYVMPRTVYPRPWLGSVVRDEERARIHGNDERLSIAGIGQFVEFVYRSVMDVAAIK
ncbi:MAG: hypothetical protein ABI977_01450 [Acidobacteriota bacterium]